MGAGYDALYAVRPPWETGQAQPALWELAEAGLVRGRVLDAGYGTGEHALMAATLGCAATGVDLSDAALDQARAKALERGLTARFERRDVLELAGWGEVFDVVLDSLVFHGFHGQQRRRYAGCSGPAGGCSCSASPRSHPTAPDGCTRSPPRRSSGHSPTAGASTRSTRSPSPPPCPRSRTVCAAGARL
jgi:SAM-dependent methyltransferase